MARWEKVNSVRDLGDSGGIFPYFFTFESREMKVTKVDNFNKIKLVKHLLGTCM